MAQKAHAWLLQRSKIYRGLIRFYKAYELRVGGGIPLQVLARFFIRNIGRESITLRASSVAFNFFISLFPTIIFLFTLLPYLPVPQLNEILLDLLRDVMPSEGYGAIQSTVKDIFDSPNSGLLSFGLIAALYFSSNGVFSLMDAFDKRDKRNFIRRRLIAIALTLGIGFTLLVAVVFLVIGRRVIEYIIYHSSLADYLTVYLLLAAQWVVIFCMLFVVCCIVFRYGDTRLKNWQFIYPGALVASILIVLTSLGFTFYVDRFSNYNKLYGSIGAIIITMLWIYLNAMMLLISHELNRAIQQGKIHVSWQMGKVPKIDKRN